VRLLFIFLVVIPLLSACEPRREDGEEGEARPQVLLTGVRMRAFDEGAMVGRGRAARLAYHRDTGEASADEAWFEVVPVEGVSHGLVHQHGPLELRTAEISGRLEDTLHARGGVRLQSRSGIDAQTPSATYAPDRRVVSGNRGVVAHKDDTHLTADGFHFNLVEETFDFEGNVETVTGVAAP